MWKRQEEQPSKPPVPAGAGNRPEEPYVAAPGSEAKPPDMKPDPNRERVNNSKAHIGRSVHIKGELSGSEDLQIDGTVEGSIELRDHHIMIGSTGKVQANINAKKVVIFGSVKGNIRAADAVEIRRTGSLMGDLIVAGVSIEEGAYFKGSIDIQRPSHTESRPELKGQPKTEPKKMDVASTSPLNATPTAVNSKALH
ncbi:MAG: polymer-forming cytoskeletal protein [Acidobacteria bacterium]|nr:polymer-forming cytoskeletal protein [Acidobacteriota bacterium]